RPRFSVPRKFPGTKKRPRLRSSTPNLFPWSSTVRLRWMSSSPSSPPLFLPQVQVDLEVEAEEVLRHRSARPLLVSQRAQELLPWVICHLRPPEARLAWIRPFLSQLRL